MQIQSVNHEIVSESCTLKISIIKKVFHITTIDGFESPTPVTDHMILPNCIPKRPWKEETNKKKKVNIIERLIYLVQSEYQSIKNVLSQIGACVCILCGSSCLHI